MEAIIDPDVPILDPHHHFASHRQYGAPQLLADIEGGHNVVGTVHIELGAASHAADAEGFTPVSETQAVVAEVTTASGASLDQRLCAGIVGSADLGAEPRILETLLDAHVLAAKGRFRGVRTHAFITFQAPEYQLMQRPNWEEVVGASRYRAGLAVLERRGLSLDVLCTHPQLGWVARLSREFENLTFIVNHLAPPPVAGPGSGEDGVVVNWGRDLAALAECPNVFLKIGGCLPPQFGSGFPSIRAAHSGAAVLTSQSIADAYAPLAEIAIDVLGPERCMFESNFPEDRVYTSYNILWNAFKRLSSKYSAIEQRALLFGAAARAYGLLDLDRPLR